MIHTFLRATQAISPAPRLKDNSEPVSGCASICFDPCSALVATRLDDSPGTVWVWDLQAAELRAVLLFHGNVTSLLWHPHVPETLLVKCEGDQYNGLVFVWDPLSEGPRTVDFGRRMPGAKAGSRSRALWLGLDASSVSCVFFSDTHSCVLACLGEADQSPPPWGSSANSAMSFSAERREESPLELVPASGIGSEDPVIEDNDDDGSELEDTFVHKR